MKRICCFCETWASGGIESFLFNVITHMDMQELEIHIVASRLTDSIFTVRLEELGVRFFELSGSQHKLLKNWKLFRALLRQHKYDVVHLNLFQGLSLRYGRLAKAAGVPVRIAHSHNTALRKTRTRPLKLLLHAMSKRIWAKSATDYWACSKAAAQFLFPSKYLQRYRFIPNGIDVGRFRFSPKGRAETRQELGLTDGEVLIGHVGRLCYQKNQSFLLDVFADVVKTRPDARLLLVGEGELRDELVAKARSLGVAEHVIFYGLSDHVERLLWAMDLFVFPSLFEGLSVVAVEAQSAGLPLLCSRQPPEVCLTDGARMLELGGADAWAAAVLELPVGGDRALRAQTVREAGFDIRSVARLIQTEYTGEKHHADT